MRIAVDIDDTLYSFSQLARSTFIDLAIEQDDKNLQRGAYCAWVEWRSPTDIVGTDFWLDIIARCHEDDVIKEQPPFPGAADTVRELHSKYEIMYISNRREDAHWATLDWLIANGFPSPEMDDGVELICTTKDKRPFLAHCQHIIDDRPKTLVEFVYDYDWTNKFGSANTAFSRKGFGLFGEYNRSLTDVPGIYLAPNWKLMRQYLIDKGVLDVGAANHH